jgi:hypothetical protein
VAPRTTPIGCCVIQASCTTLLIKDLTDTRSDFAQIELRYFCLLSRAAVPFGRWKISPAVKNALEQTDRYLFRAFPGSGLYMWMMVRMMSGLEGGEQ